MRKGDFMKRLILLVLMSFTIIGCGHALQDSHLNSVREKAHEKMQDKVFLNQFHVVFVAGFFNETFPAYFLDNIKVLKDEFRAESITRIFPSSLEGTLENEAYLFSEILKSYQSENNKPLVVVSHSKGAVELLNVMFKHPELMEQKTIEKVILIQAAIGGSYVADISDDVLSLIAPFAASCSGGLKSLRKGYAEKLLTTAYETLSLEQRKNIANKIYFVRSAQRAKKTTPFLIPTQKYLAMNYGKNDGLLLVEDQIFEPLINDGSTDLGVVDADHSDLVFSELESLTSDKIRYEFTRNLFRRLF